MTDTYTTQPGDVFVEQWGYDQSNVDAFVVVRVSKTRSTVYLKPCGLTKVGQGHSTRMKPNPKAVREFHSGYARIGKELPDGSVAKRIKVSGYDGAPYIRLTSYSHGYLWDRQSSYFDTIAAGYPGH